MFSFGKLHLKQTTKRNFDELETNLQWELVQQPRWDMWCNHLMITLRVRGKNCGIMPSSRNSIKQMAFIKVINGRNRLDQFKH